MSICLRCTGFSTYGLCTCNSFKYGPGLIDGPIALTMPPLNDKEFELAAKALRDWMIQKESQKISAPEQLELNLEKETLKDLQEKVHGLAKEKGWWTEKRTDGEIIMLMISELAEGFEEVRNGKPSYYVVDGKPEGLAVELADCMLRILDYAGYRGWDMGDIINKKHEYNKSRAYRHGGKKL